MLPARLLRLVVLSGALLSLASCGLLVGLGNYAQEAGDAAPGDGSVADGPGRDGGGADGDATLGDSPFDAKDTALLGDAPDADASSDALDELNPPIVYNDITQSSNWETVDLTQVGLASAQAFNGAVFDGQYLYLVPSGNGGVDTVLRFDTTMSLTMPGSWATFDATQLVVYPDTATFHGGVFDGHYVYFAPQGDTLAVRYDASKDFSSLSSWEAYDVLPVAGPVDFNGAVFDGRYVYLVPSTNQALTQLAAQVVRFDTEFSSVDGGSSAFDAGGAWSTFDIAAAVDPNAGGYAGGVFDGRYLYLVPFAGPANTYGNRAFRYDSMGSFDDGGAWASLVAGDSDAGAGGFSGGVYDGQHIYFVPRLTGQATPDGVVVQCNAISEVPTTFNLTTLDPRAIGFGGGVFDGRYVYLVPDGSNVSAGGSDVSRYDTMAATLTIPSAWSFFNATGLTPDASAGTSAFGGGAFDGQYVYLIPFGSTILARFDARTKAPVPSTVHGGSFF